MSRANLRGLIGNLGDTETPEQTSNDEASEAAANADTAPVRPSETTALGAETLSPVGARRSPGRTTSGDDADPPSAHFSDFQRKETRLREDQQNALTEHARRLNRMKGVGGPRITDNTLIRVAVDLLLSRADRLSGRDEASLRRSLGVRDGEQ